MRYCKYPESECAFYVVVHVSRESVWSDMLAHDQLITCSLSPEVTTAFFWRKLHLQVIKIHSVM